MLEVIGLHSYHGGIHALQGVDFSIKAGEIVTLIGANGAGKSTLVMTICGNPKAREGRILFEGDDITSLPTFEIARRGVAQVPEGRRIFPRMTVFENLQIGATLADRSKFANDIDRAYTIFPILKERYGQLAGTLSGGEQQMLAIARALMGRPRLLMLDEPSLGLAPLMIRSIFSVIATINRDHDMTVLLIEQNAHMALRLAHRAYVMQNGRIVISGTGQDLLYDNEVCAAYLKVNDKTISNNR